MPGYIELRKYSTIWPNENNLNLLIFRLGSPENECHSRRQEFNSLSFALVCHRRRKMKFFSAQVSSYNFIEFSFPKKDQEEILWHLLVCCRIHTRCRQGIQWLALSSTGL